MTDSVASRSWPLALRLAAIWLVYVAWSSSAGWILSWFGQLNRTGYLLALVPLLAASAALWKTTAGGNFVIPRIYPHLKRPAVAAWMLVAILCLVGGILYAPSNYDGLSYRLPRILYWWQENRWQWLEDADSRMNYSGAGLEWQTLPLMVLSGSDRLLFLLNWIPFLFFPALTFHALKTFSVGNSAAARWMWILPLCYGFALQASSIGNDGLGGILTVASLAFSGLAEKRRSLAALVLAAIAASALGGLKLSNLPLMLPIGIFWLKAAWSMRSAIRGWSLIPGIVAIILTSFLPLAVLNQVHCGNWAGDPNDDFKLRITKTLPGLVGNTFNLVVGTVELPVFPISSESKRRIRSHLEGEQSLTSYVQSGFPRFRPGLGGEIPMEEGSGVGLGVTLLLAIHFFQRRRSAHPQTLQWIALGATTLSVAAYMAKMGSESTVRLILPYYPVMLAALLAITQRRCPRSPWLRGSYVFLPLLCLMPGLTLNPNRPLIPLSTLAEIPAFPDGIRTRIRKLNEAYSSRSDPLQAIRKDIPENCDVIGFAGGPTQSAYSLFKPVGTRRVIEVNRANAESFEWLVAAPTGIRERVGKSWEEWQSFHEHLTWKDKVFSPWVTTSNLVTCGAVKNLNQTTMNQENKHERNQQSLRISLPVRLRERKSKWRSRCGQ